HWFDPSIAHPAHRPVPGNGTGLLAIPAPGRIYRPDISFVADVLIDVQVLLAGPRPRVVGAHAVGDQLRELARAGGPQPEGPAQRGFDGPVVGVVEDVPVTLPQRAPGLVVVEHGVGHAAGGPHHWHGPVLHPDQRS